MHVDGFGFGSKQRFQREVVELEMVNEVPHGAPGIVGRAVQGYFEVEYDLSCCLATGTGIPALHAFRPFTGGASVLGAFWDHFLAFAARVFFSGFDDFGVEERGGVSVVVEAHSGGSFLILGSIGSIM